MKQSKIFTLNYLDILKGIVVAVIASVVEQLINFLQDPEFHITWNKIARMALIAFFSYILKNFFTPAQKTDS